MIFYALLRNEVKVFDLVLYITERCGRDFITSAAPCHSNRMILKEEGMAYGVAAHASIAMDWLNLL